MVEIPNVILHPDLARYFQEVVFRFTPKQSAEILHILKLHADNPQAIKFLEQSQRAIGIYQIRRSNAEIQPTPKIILTRMKAVQGQIAQTLKTLTHLDPDIEGRLRLDYQDPTHGVSVTIPPEPCVPLVELIERLTQLHNLLNDQISRARSRVQRGRAIDTVLRHCIYQVVETFGLCFGHLPPSTRKSSFEKALAVILKAGGVVQKDLHKHIQTALKMAKEQKSASP